MSNISRVIETLAREWSWEAISQDPAKRSLILLEGNLFAKVVDAGGYTSEFTLRHTSKNRDVRMWTKSKGGLLQWRTGPVKGDRLVYKAFNKSTQAEKIPLEEIFLTPKNVSEEEVEFFKILYPELVPMIPLFAGALAEFNNILAEGGKFK